MTNIIEVMKYVVQSWELCIHFIHFLQLCSYYHLNASVKIRCSKDSVLCDNPVTVYIPIIFLCKPVHQITLFS